MSEQASSAESQQQDGASRRTNEGRNLSSIPYANEEELREDLRRISASLPQAESPAEHWTERPSRSTGARRRIC